MNTPQNDYLAEINSKVGQYAYKKFSDNGVSADGVFSWFRQTHKGVHEKFERLTARMEKIINWDDPFEQEQYKKLCRQYVDVMKWLVDKFVQHVKKSRQMALNKEAAA